MKKEKKRIGNVGRNKKNEFCYKKIYIIIYHVLF